jgi:thiamine pyrophosphokinase
LFGFGHAGFLCGQGGRVDQFAEHMQVIELWVLR